MIRNSQDVLVAVVVVVVAGFPTSATASAIKEAY